MKKVLFLILLNLSVVPSVMSAADKPPSDEVIVTTTLETVL